MQNTVDNTATTPEPKRSILFKIFAVSGIILGIMALIFLVHCFWAFQRMICQDYAFGIGLTAKVYANDHDGLLPPADKWYEIFLSDYDCDPKMFTCPAASGNECTYAMNINVAGKNINEIPPDTVLFFEIEGGSKLYGGPELLTARHSLGNNINVSSIVFADGHPELVRTERYDTLRWNPAQQYTPQIENTSVKEKLQDNLTQEPVTTEQEIAALKARATDCWDKRKANIAKLKKIKQQLDKMFFRGMVTSKGKKLFAEMDVVLNEMIANGNEVVACLTKLEEMGVDFSELECASYVEGSPFPAGMPGMPMPGMPKMPGMPGMPSK